MKLRKDEYIEEIQERVQRLNRLTPNETIKDLMGVLGIKTDIDGNIMEEV
jgi:hypothetical protein